MRKSKRRAASSSEKGGGGGGPRAGPKAFGARGQIMGHSSFLMWFCRTVGFVCHTSRCRGFKSWSNQIVSTNPCQSDSDRQE